jgi:hypothetical protein
MTAILPPLGAAVNRFMFGAVLLGIIGIGIAVSDYRPWNQPPVRSASAPAMQSDDVSRIYRLGEAAVRGGLATEYRVSGWGQTLDLTISSLLPGDARAIAAGVCAAAQKDTWSDHWTVRVFLPIGGDRPAATCPI